MIDAFGNPNILKDIKKIVVMYKYKLSASTLIGKTMTWDIVIWVVILRESFYLTLHLFNCFVITTESSV